MSKKIRVIILCGGPSTEHEVSLKSGKMVFEQLDRKKYIPEICIVGKDEGWKIGKDKPIGIIEAFKKIKEFDFAFIAMHGAFGEDGRLQAILEAVGMPYNGSGVASSAVAMDKNLSNMIYAAHGLLIPKHAIIEKSSMKNVSSFSLPVVIKPVEGGSSVGVSIIRKRTEFSVAIKKSLKSNKRLMIQEYIKGREFTCGVIEKEGRPVALSPTEIIPRTASFFDYSAKYKVGGSREVTPADLPARQIKELQRLALAAHQLLGCSGMSRSDFILRDRRFYILETNTIPGMTQTSLLPQAAKVSGITFPKLLDLMILAGFRRANENLSTASTSKRSTSPKARRGSKAN